MAANPASVWRKNQPRLRSLGCTRRNSAHIIGVVVSEIARLTMIASERVSANSRNSLPTMPPISRIGRNTAISEVLMESTVKPTSPAPSRAACTRGTPSSMCRAMFSSTTIASSTTKPVEIVSAISERLSRLKPSRYIAAKVPMMDTGTATAGMSVARALARKTNTTAMTSTMAMTSVRCVSSSEARTVGVRSMATDTSVPPGSEACRRGSTARMPLTVEMMLAPGCRNTIRTTVFWPLNRPELRRSSTLSSTSATSVSRTAALLR